MKKGFTLIELLAVIVILAIIALIATPIIINIIENAKEESEKRSIELYASAVKNAIASYQLNHTNVPTSINDLTVEYDGDVECSTSIIGKNGNVYLKDCTVNGNKVDYNYGSHFNTVCTPVTEKTKTTGNVPSGAYEVEDEYTCEVKEGTSYTFFILSKEDNKINLIMDSNVRKDGTPVKDTTDKGLVAWITHDDYIAAGGIETDWGEKGNNNKGPITAMKYLQIATSSWTKVSSIVETYSDEGNHYGEIKLTGHARMPKISEVGATGCNITNHTAGTCPLWMANYLQASTSEYPTRTAVSGVYGYWTLSSPTSFTRYALGVDYRGSDVNFDVYAGGASGIRPVITLSI